MDATLSQIVSELVTVTMQRNQVAKTLEDANKKLEVVTEKLKLVEAENEFLKKQQPKA